MPIHEFGFLSTFVIGLVAAFAGGLAARSLKLPPLLGYLLAGVVIGFFKPSLMANQAMANELAEVGVALLLFNIGLHFSFKDLFMVRRIVIPGAIIQVLVTAFVGAMGAYWIIHTSIGASIVIGLSLAIASTAVSTRVLDERQQLTTLVGRIALGWLVVQDVIVIIGLVLFPVLGSMTEMQPSSIVVTLGKTLLQVAGFVAVMVVGGRRAIPWLLGYVARVGSRELFTLCVIVVALGIAYGSALIFGVSLALGAFFAGVVIGESDLHHHAASEAVSMQQVFTILFFVSVGMLFDPRSVMSLSLEIVTFLGIIIFGTGFLTFCLLVAMRIPLQAAALVGATFAQIGEFSFVLSELGHKNGFYGAGERDLIVAVALLSIMINPLILSLSLRLARWSVGQPWVIKWQSRRTEISLPEVEGLRDHTILIGHGRVGRIVASALSENGLRYIAIESDRALTERLRLEGKQVIYGDASREAVLAAARPEYAKIIIVAVPDPYLAKQIVKVARKNYPTIPIVVRTHSDEEARAMTKLGVGFAVMGEREIAFGLIYYVLQTLGFELDHARTTIVNLRKAIYDLDQKEA